jgi:hypothetical protein
MAAVQQSLGTHGLEWLVLVEKEGGVVGDKGTLSACPYASVCSARPSRSSSHSAFPPEPLSRTLAVGD